MAAHLLQAADLLGSLQAVEKQNDLLSGLVAHRQARTLLITPRYVVALCGSS